MSINRKVVSNYKEIERNLHSHRLAEYSANGLFDQAKTLKRYRYNIELSSCLYSSFSILEVALRNKVTESWTNYFKHSYDSHFHGNLRDWPLDSRGMYFFVASKGHSPYDKKFKFHLEKVEKEKQDLEREFENTNNIIRKSGTGTLKSVRNGDVVARLSFGFWRNCFESKYNDINRWAIPKIFPNKTFAPATIINEIKTVNEELTKLNTLRNRFSHQEKIFHYNDLDIQYQLIEKYINQINPNLLFLFDKNKFNELWAKRSRYF